VKAEIEPMTLTSMSPTLRSFVSRLLILSAASVAFSGCSEAQPPAKKRTEPTTTLSVTPIAGVKSMTKARKCAGDSVSLSICMAEMVLADIRATYGNAGGGVSEIRALSSTSWQASMSQEEREDMITYEFDVAKDGTVSIKSKKESTKSY
jgi:hypothetical protein